MFGKKPELVEGANIFSTKKNREFFECPIDIIKDAINKVNNVFLNNKIIYVDKLLAKIKYTNVIGSVCYRNSSYFLYRIFEKE